jgi:serine/threonine protein kinase
MTFASSRLVGVVQCMDSAQLVGNETAACADLWSLGCLLYKTVTGRHSFERASSPPRAPHEIPQGFPGGSR